jgi:hypothetical protein
MMSDQLQRRLAAEEAQEAKEAAREERARAQRAEAHQENAIQAAISQALAEGREFSPRWLRGERVGHTTSEFIAARSAQMDVEDAQLAARQRVAYNRWLAQQGELHSADLSATTIEAERAEEAWREDQRARSQVIRGRNLRRKRIVEDARKAAAGDSARLVGGLAAAVVRDRRGY